VTQQPTPTHDLRTAPPQAAPTINAVGNVSTPWQLPWPQGCIARYWTTAGATVDITEIGANAQHGYSLACTGCPHWETPGTEDEAHSHAQAHAETCRALPRPAAPQ
jgi:hypothetical protein